MADVLAAFGHPKKARGGWMARCPAHEDKRSSLSIGCGDDGRWLLKCHAGCTLDAILTAAHLAMRDLFPKTTTTKAKIVATYSYHDARGKHLYDVVRFAPKDFRQRRANGEWTMNGVRRVLYRLPELHGQAAVYITEGEKDTDRLHAIGLASTTNVGGAGKWRDEYSTQLVTAGVQCVYVLPDNDEPGRAHGETVAASCTAAGLTVRTVELPDLPPKGDVSDWLARGHTVDELRMLAERPSPSTPTKRERLSLCEVEAVFSRWICGKDTLPTRAVLAAYVANHLDGDPVWLMLVGGSGVGKTERLRPLAALPDVLLESSITGPAALLSGTSKKERAKDASGGLLQRIPNGQGVLVLKDFTSILDMHRDARAEVLAALHEIQDGRWTRSVGTDGGRTLKWTGHLGILAACTTAIDAAHSVIATMGARFLYVRLHEDDDIAQSALAHVGAESVMRDALSDAVRALLTNLPGQELDIATVREPLVGLSRYVARARSPVHRSRWGREIDHVMAPEAPTRVIKMLALLWRAAGRLGLDPTEAWQLVKRIGFDSIPPDRHAVLDYLTKTTDAQTTTAIAEATDFPTQTARRALEDLVAHRVLRRETAGPGRPDRWEFTDSARKWVRQATFPALSGSGEEDDGVV